MNKISKKDVEKFNQEQNATPINIRRIERKLKNKILQIIYLVQLIY